MNIENKWKNMDAEKSSFIVEKCERVMECVIADRELLQKKANLLLGLVGGVVTLAIGVWLDPKRNLPEIVEQALGLEILLLLIAGVVAILTCLMPSKYAAPGGDPKLMLQPEFANQEMTWLRIGYCAMLQKGIDMNLKRNTRIAIWIRVVAVFVFASPVLAHLGQKFIPQPAAAASQSLQAALSPHSERYSGEESSHREQRYLKAHGLSALPLRTGATFAAAPVVEAQTMAILGVCCLRSFSFANVIGMARRGEARI